MNLFLFVQDTYVYAKELYHDLNLLPEHRVYYGHIGTWFTCGGFIHCPKWIYMTGEMYIFSRDVLLKIVTSKRRFKTGPEDIISGITFMSLLRF